MEDKKAAVETAVLQALDKAGAIDDSRTLGLDMKLVDGAVRSLLAFEMITCEVRAGAAAAVPQPSPIAPGSALQAQKPPTHLSRGCLRSLADRHALHGPADGAGPGFRLNPRQIPRPSSWAGGGWADAAVAVGNAQEVNIAGWTLQAEGKEAAEKGSPEARCFALVPADGIPLAELKVREFSARTIRQDGGATPPPPPFPFGAGG